ncbi:2,3-diketo-l-gulonate reductase [Escherichia coli]|uniref:2,3-diketo-l-gulonate reductase n=1 Tax=Escherichia coli TaxID=562 RepID=A0A2X1NE12_ECOLX|nr:2,3-diketo-l-gulonate reductase [Escherichia coli]
MDAQRSIGNLTAKKMMDRAIELAADHGIGLVALRMPTTGCGAAATVAGGGKRLYWHLLDQLHRRNAGRGAQKSVALALTR